MIQETTPSSTRVLMPDFLPPAKGYRLVFEDCGKYLLASVSGEQDSLEISVNYWREIEQEVLKRQATRLLVRENFATSVPNSEMLTVAMLISRFRFKNVRLAFLDDEPEHFDQNKLAEMVVAKNGIVIQVFSDFKEAENWLLERRKS